MPDHVPFYLFRLMGLIEEKTIENEDLRHARDSAIKKLKIREKRLKDVEEYNVHCNGDLKSKTLMTEKLTKEKNNLLNELKESRYEVSSLKKERNKLKIELKSHQKYNEKEIGRLTSLAKGSLVSFKHAHTHTHARTHTHT